MNLSTRINIPEIFSEITYQDKLMFLGSCFADSIGAKFSESKFTSTVNPFGVLYNPISVSNALLLAMGIKQVKENDLINHNGLWHSFYHHGSFSTPHKSELLERIEQVNKDTFHQLKSSDYLFVTFGTAWVYSYCKTQQIVSNNHKIPNISFERFRLSVAKIVEVWSMVLEQLKQVNPTLKVVFTVSPVRHLKDGAHQNQLSKSALLLAVEELVENISNLQYFPSYELVLDELRDYRFYADDLIHPSSLAINYIFERISDKWITKDTLAQMAQVQKIVKAATHRPFNPDTKEHQVFISKTLARIKQIKQAIPQLDLSKEEQLLMQQVR